MISLGGRFLKRLLLAKALLRGELSAQQTEGFQMPPHADSKQNGITPCEVTVPSKLYGMELVQNIARESRLTLSRRRIILPFSSGRILSYFILPHPTLSYFILLFRSHHGIPWEKVFEAFAVRQGSPARGAVCAAD